MPEPGIQSHSPTMWQGPNHLIYHGVSQTLHQQGAGALLSCWGCWSLDSAVAGTIASIQLCTCELAPWAAQALPDLRTSCPITPDQMEAPSVGGTCTPGFLRLREVWLEDVSWTQFPKYNPSPLGAAKSSWCVPCGENHSNPCLVIGLLDSAGLVPDRLEYKPGHQAWPQPCSCAGGHKDGLRL